MMAIEEEASDVFVLPDGLAARAETSTFADLVHHVAKVQSTR